MNHTEQVLTRRYATALLRVCGDKFTQDDLGAMHRAADFFRTHSSALYFLGLPDLDVREKKVIVQKLFEIVKLPDCFRNLVHLLGQHKRMKLVAPVLDATLRLYQEQHGITDVHIESSAPLDEAQLQTIQAFLADTTAKTINYTYDINPELIAGIRLQSDTLLWEYSARKKLRAIRLSVLR